MDHEVFISHATADRVSAMGVWDALRTAGTSSWIAPHDIPGGTPYGLAVVRAIDACRVFVLLLSKAANASEFVPREVERAASKGKCIILVRVEAVEPAEALELFVSATQWCDVFGQNHTHYMPRLVSTVQSQLKNFRPTPGSAMALMAALAVRPDGRADPVSEKQVSEVEPRSSVSAVQSQPGGVEGSKTPPVLKKKVVMVYRRRASPDDQVLALLEAELTRAGHKVFIDRHLMIGVQWAAQIEQEIKSADAVLALLSNESVHSEMLTYELQLAHQAAQTNGGQPNLFPVRVNFDGRLPNELAPILEPIQYFSWRSASDNNKLVAGLLAALEAPPASPKPRLESVGGAVPLDSELYIERPTDELFRAAVERRDSIILLYGARQMGKTSLLARGLQKARASRVKVVLTDFQSLAAAELSSLEAFYLGLAERIADQLELDIDPRESWRGTLSPNSNFERFLKRKILGAVEGHWVWVMDEVDRLFSCSFGAEVFGLFRSWHNARATDPSAPWGRLTMAIAYATEAQLFITDPNQSPFNVGTRIALEDFTQEQVQELNRRHGSPLKAQEELTALYDLIGGQPYLNRRAMYEMVGRGLPLSVFKEGIDRDNGPFGDHLRRLLVLLAPNELMMAAIREVLNGRPCPTTEIFFRLRSAGLLKGGSREECELRCHIYEIYLRRHIS